MDETKGIVIVLIALFLSAITIVCILAFYNISKNRLEAESRHGTRTTTIYEQWYGDAPATQPK